MDYLHRARYQNFGKETRAHTEQKSDGKKADFQQESFKSRGEDSRGEHTEQKSDGKKADFQQESFKSHGEAIGVVRQPSYNYNEQPYQVKEPVAEYIEEVDENGFDDLGEDRGQDFEGEGEAGYIEEVHQPETYQNAGEDDFDDDDGFGPGPGDDFDDFDDL